jgi:putative Mn2+ efflux pump MntP
MTTFEMAMPLAGLGVGRGLGSALGGAADVVAAAILLLLGAYLLVAADDEADRLGSFSGRWPALLAVGLAVSLDELAMGFTIGLLGLSIVAAVLLIGGQAVVASQLGFRVGARLGAAVREGAERLAALALVALGVLVLVQSL